MLDEKICKVREKLNDSILTGQDYSVTYELSIALDKLIAEYYQAELSKALKDKNKKPKGKLTKLMCC